MFKISFKPVLLASLLAVVAQGAWAADALTLTVTQTLPDGDHSQTLVFKSLDDMVNTYKNEAQLRASLNWDYDSHKGSTAVMNNLGVKFYFTIDPFTNGKTIVHLDVPGTTLVDKAYEASTQDAALTKMKEDIKAQYSSIQKTLAQTTPNSLTAGNPSSVQSQLASSQFDQGFTNSATQVISTSAVTAATTTTTSTTASTSSASSSTAASSSSTSSSSSSASNNSSLLTGLVGLGLRFGQFKQGDIKTQTITLPLSYAWRFDEDERRHITLATPLTIGKIDQSSVFNAQLGLSVGIPINEQWALTPAIGYGIAGSVDLAQAAQQVSGSLTSSYIWSFENGQSVAMGNMVGYYTTVKMKVDDYTSNPDISNTILRNGLMYSVPIDFDVTGDTGISAEFSIINTHYLGTELFVKTSNEFGITLGTNKRVKGATRYLRAGLSFIQAKHANGFGVNIGYWF